MQCNFNIVLLLTNLIVVISPDISAQSLGFHRWIMTATFDLFSLDGSLPDDIMNFAFYFYI